MKNKQVIEYVEKVFNDNEANLGKQRSLLEGLIQQGQKEGNEFLIGVAYFYMSVSYYDESDYINMLTNALKAIEFIKDTNEYKLIARVYTILGYAYGLQGNFQLEYTNHEKAYQIVKKKRIKGTLLVTVLNNLAICYHELGQTSTPIKFYQECIDYVKESEPDNYDDLAMYSLNIAECYKDSNNVDKANEVLSLMEKWIDKVSFIPLVCDYYLRYSILSYHVNDIEKGNIYLDKAFELIPQNIYPHPIYDDLMKMLNNMYSNNFASLSNKDYYVVFNDTKDIINYIESSDSFEK